MEITNQEFPATLKLNASYYIPNAGQPHLKTELRHIPQDCNYITFSTVTAWNLRT